MFVKPNSALFKILIIRSSVARLKYTTMSYAETQMVLVSHVPGSAPGCCSGNGEKLSSTQAESGQAIKSAVA